MTFFILTNGYVQGSVLSMPSSYVYDRSDQLVDMHVGFKTKDANEMRETILSLLNK